MGAIAPGRFVIAVWHDVRAVSAHTYFLNWHKLANVLRSTTSCLHVFLVSHQALQSVGFSLAGFFGKWRPNTILPQGCVQCLVFRSSPCLVGVILFCTIHEHCFTVHMYVRSRKGASVLTTKPGVIYFSVLNLCATFRDPSMISLLHAAQQYGGRISCADRDTELRALTRGANALGHQESFRERGDKFMLVAPPPALPPVGVKSGGFG